MLTSSVLQSGSSIGLRAASRGGAHAQGRSEPAQICRCLALSWNTVLQSPRESFPDRGIAQDVPDLDDHLAVVEPASGAEALLRDMGQDWFLSRKESLRRTFTPSGLK